ncbi:MAG: smalltalk protein, partial [Prevotellaceae bacterium]|nr:smalltalk protein [Prevotellaceae bacterium]
SWKTIINAIAQAAIAVLTALGITSCSNWLG